ncbi:MAG: hypothetical protein AAGH99_10340 [Planctomycetota bacterium]
METNENLTDTDGEIMTRHTSAPTMQVSIADILSRVGLNQSEIKNNPTKAFNKSMRCWIRNIESEVHDDDSLKNPKLAYEREIKLRHGREIIDAVAIEEMFQKIVATM